MSQLTEPRRCGDDPAAWLRQQQAEHAQQADELTAELQHQWDAALQAQRQRHEQELRQFQHACQQLEAETPEPPQHALPTPRQPVQPQED